MPREIAHFLAVDNAVERLPQLKSLVEGQRLGLEALYLGSITPDSPYYLPVGGAEDVAEFVHGKNGNDTFAVLRSLISQPVTATQENNQLLFLFSIGILTHIIVDAVMHPFVNLLSGDYYSENLSERKQTRTLHRRLETDLDFYLLRFSKPKYESLLHLRAALGENISRLSSYLDASLKGCGQSSTYKTYWLSHAFVYFLFDKKFFAKLNFIPSEINALCGRGREPCELFSVKSKYPVGENLYFQHQEGELDLFELYLLAQNVVVKQTELFIKDSAKYLRLIGPSLADGTVQKYD